METEKAIRAYHEHLSEIMQEIVETCSALYCLRLNLISTHPDPKYAAETLESCEWSMKRAQRHLHEAFEFPEEKPPELPAVINQAIRPYRPDFLTDYITDDGSDLRTEPR